MNYYPKSEKEMVSSVLSVLEMNNTPLAIEVPFLNRSIDLVFENKGGELTTIEFKRHDWRRAIIQASDHKLGSKSVYICLPESKISYHVKNEILNSGVGLISWSPEEPMEFILDSEQSDLYLPQFNYWLRENFLFRMRQGALS